MRCSILVARCIGEPTSTRQNILWNKCICAIINNPLLVLYIIFFRITEVLVAANEHLWIPGKGGTYVYNADVLSVIL